MFPLKCECRIVDGGRWLCRPPRLLRTPACSVLGCDTIIRPDTPPLHSIPCPLLDTGSRGHICTSREGRGVPRQKPEYWVRELTRQLNCTSTDPPYTTLRIYPCIPRGPFSSYVYIASSTGYVDEASCTYVYIALSTYVHGIVRPHPVQQPRFNDKAVCGESESAFYMWCFIAYGGSFVLALGAAVSAPDNDDI